MKASPFVFFVLSAIEQGTHFERRDLSSESGSTEDAVYVIQTSLLRLTCICDINILTLPKVEEGLQD